MDWKPTRGTMIIQAIVVVFIIASIVSALLSITTAGTNLELSRDFKHKSRDIGEAVLDLSLDALRQATDGFDNDGDGTIDEGLDQPDIFVPSVMEILEGRLGRLGTLKWTLSDDSNGNGLPDFGETGVEPLALSGGEAFAYSIFSERDGLDNDKDGTIDEEDEAGSVSLFAQGRYNNYTSQLRFTGIFTNKWFETEPPKWTASGAFAAGGDIRFLGNGKIYGTEGNVHSNGYMVLGGSAYVKGNATSSNGGDIDPDNVEGYVDTSAPMMPIPDINLSSLLALREQAVADGKDVYLLKNNGHIVKNGSIVSKGGSYHGWQMSANGTWTLSSTKADLDGLFYAGGNVNLKGSKQLINMTVLTEGNISMNGNGNFKAYYDNFFLVALKDISLSGTPQSSGDLGAILCREQIKTVGTTFIRGTILAADLESSSSLVEETTIGGNFDIEYNGDFVMSIPVFDPNHIKYKFEPMFSGYEER